MGSTWELKLLRRPRRHSKFPLHSIMHESHLEECCFQTSVCENSRSLEKSLTQGMPFSFFPLDSLEPLSWPRISSFLLSHFTLNLSPLNSSSRSFLGSTSFLEAERSNLKAAVKRTDFRLFRVWFAPSSSGMNLTVESLINDSSHQFLYLLNRVNFKKPMEEWPKHVRSKLPQKVTNSFIRLEGC